MKKLIIILLLLFLGFNSFGQVKDRYEMNQHSIEVSVSDASVVTSAGILIGVIVWSAEAIAMSIGGDNSDTPQASGIASWTPYFTVGYNHHFPDTRWDIGGEVGFWHMGLNLNNGDRILGFLETTSITSKYFYKPSGKCKLYGGVNLGIGFLEVNDFSIFPAFQVNPIGLRLGDDRVSFVAELGFGYKGILQTGIIISL